MDNTSNAKGPYAPVKFGIVRKGHINWSGLGFSLGRILWENTLGISYTNWSGFERFLEQTFLHTARYFSGQHVK